MIEYVLRGEYPNKMFDKDTLAMVSITRKEIEKKDLSPIVNIIERLKKNPKDGRGKVAILFDGYNDDPREIYEIDEIREYVDAIFVRYSYFPYFITNIQALRSIIFACLCDIVSVKPENEISNPIFNILEGKKAEYTNAGFAPPPYVKKRFENGMKKYGSKIGEDQEIIKKIIEDTYYGGVEVSPVDRNTLFDTFMKTYSSASVATWNIQTGAIEELTFREANDKIEELGEIINLSINKDVIMLPLFKDENTRYNIFIHSSNKPICECGSGNIIIFKRNIKEYNIEDIDKVYSLFPPVEVYMENRISPLEEKFMQNLPVPIVKGEDKYYCLSCKSWHSFE